MTTETPEAVGDAVLRGALMRCVRAQRAEADRQGSLSAGREELAAAVAVVEGFVAELARLAAQFGGLAAGEAAELGRHAAQQAAASASWSQIVGDRLDTSQVTELLGVTRQALAKRQASGSLVGLRGRRTTWFPAWQFDSGARCVRPIVRDVTAAFRKHLGEADAVLIASWATTLQAEDLDGETAADWIESGGDAGRVTQAAHRAAARLAQ